MIRLKSISNESPNSVSPCVKIPICWILLDSIIAVEFRLFIVATSQTDEEQIRDCVTT